MNSTEPLASTLELVAAAGSGLTPTERRIAEAVVAEPTLLAFGTVSALAERVGTSRPSIVRFATKLGFEGYSDLQAHVRSDLSHQLSRPSDRIRHADDSTIPAKLAINDAIASVFDAVDGERMAELARPLARAEKVWILSGETSQAGARALYSGLSMVRPGVRWLREHAIATELSDVGPKHAAVVFDFYRYRRQLVAAASVLAESGATVVAITDSPLSPLVRLTETWCRIEVPAIGPFDSSVPVVAISELLTAQTARDLQDEATDRIDRIEALWERTGVFL